MKIKAKIKPLKILRFEIMWWPSSLSTINDFFLSKNENKILLQQIPITNTHSCLYVFCTFPSEIMNKWWELKMQSQYFRSKTKWTFLNLYWIFTFVHNQINSIKKTFRTKGMGKNKTAWNGRDMHSIWWILMEWPPIYWMQCSGGNSQFSHYCSVLFCSVISSSFQWITKMQFTKRSSTMQKP